MPILTVKIPKTTPKLIGPIPPLETKAETYMLLQNTNLKHEKKQLH